MCIYVYIHLFYVNFILIGDGSELSPLNLYMSTLKLLRLADGRNQNNLALYHLDGTYRITINNFPYSVFGCSDMNRKFFPIALLLLSNEKAETLANFSLCSF